MRKPSGSVWNGKPIDSSTRAREAPEAQEAQEAHETRRGPQEEGPKAAAIWPVALDFLGHGPGL